MKNVSFAVRHVHAVQPHDNRQLLWCFTLVLLSAGTVACGPVGSDAAFSQEELAQQEAAVLVGVESSSGVHATNGINVNGINVNGINVNGINVNGINVNGLSTVAFSTWFDEDPTQRATLMRYIVACAVPAGQTRTYTSPATGITHTWQGVLGLAPDWSSGVPASVAEQQVVTACLAAHANKFGLQIPISLLGRSATGTPIPYTAEELATYSENEACFFGNIFNDTGLFAANDRTFLHASESTTRACGLSSRVSNSECPPMAHVGSCKSFCTLDSSRKFYTGCTYNGVTYQPITTRIRPVDIYTCGDGVCQFTESCGTGGTYDNCFADCGSCP
jgi:hypothetical protein